jgi:prepilin-type N-terminal cleavage/methylation domain-containing protein
MVSMIKLTHALRRRLGGSRGFTLVELLVVILLVGILAGAMLGLYVGLVRSFAASGNRIVNQDDARLAVNGVARYIRMATSSASNLTTVSDAINYARPQELVMYADINGNGKPDKVRLYLSGLTLKMSTVAPNMSTSPPSYPAYTTDGVIILNGVRNGSAAIFTYYQYDSTQNNLLVISNPTTAVDLGKIVAVGMTLYVNEVPKLNAGNVQLDSLTQIRQRYNGGLGGS